MPKKSPKQRRAEALERNAAWQLLLYEEQLKVLAGRPGECRRQIARIKTRMKNPLR